MICLTIKTSITSKNQFSSSVYRKYPVKTGFSPPIKLEEMQDATTQYTTARRRQTTPGQRQGRLGGGGAPPEGRDGDVATRAVTPPPRRRPAQADDEKLSGEHRAGESEMRCRVGGRAGEAYGRLAGNGSEAAGRNWRGESGEQSGGMARAEGRAGQGGADDPVPADAGLQRIDRPRDHPPGTRN